MSSGRRKAIWLMVLCASTGGLVYWFYSPEQRPIAQRETAHGKKVERLIDNPEKLRFSTNTQIAAAQQRMPMSYHWSAEDIREKWRRSSDKGAVILISPPLDLKGVDDLDSIIIRTAPAASLTRFTLLWNDKPTFSRPEWLRNRRELVAITKQAQTLLIRGEEIADINFLGTEKDERAVRHFFLRFPAKASAVGMVDSFSLVSKAARFASAAYGYDRQAFQGEIRDLLYLKTPGTITYQTSLPGDAEFYFGVRNLDRSSALRYTVELDHERKTTTLFDQEVKESSGWRDFHVKLPPADNGTIRLDAWASTGSNVALWSNPMIVAPGPDRPNIVLYVVDALRADHLGFYGYPKKTSPFLDELARQGVVFLNCYSPSSWTKPSVATLLTSLYPQTHAVGSTSYTDLLPESALTLQDFLRSNGYVTAQFAANPLVSTLSNLDQGFDFVFTSNSFSISRSEGKQNKIHSDDLNSRILPWLKEHSRTRFFLYVHSVDPHPPFSAPETPTHFARKARTAEKYDAEIYFNDRQIKRLYRELLNLGLAQNTLFVVTSDHGEAFNEHGQSGHGVTVYEEEVRVPLLMIHPGRLHPRVVSERVQLIDVMPTILAHCSIPIDSKVDGINVLALLKSAHKKRTIYVTRSAYPQSPEEGFQRAEHYAIVEDHWKLIVTQALNQPDPGLNFTI